MTGTRLLFSFLFRALFEPELDALPDAIWLGGASGLETLWFKTSPVALVVMRKELRDKGHDHAARALTYAIRRTERQFAISKPWLEQKIHGWFNLVFFEWTVCYGFCRTRPLWLLLGLGAVCWPVYVVALVLGRGTGAIWRVPLADRVLANRGPSEPERVTVVWSRGDTAWWRGLGLQQSLRVLAFGAYFSLVSAFQLGWRDLNLGAWITRVQTSETTLRATGWVRTVSGVQALVSLALVVLWALSFFGTPFD